MTDAKNALAELSAHLSAYMDFHRDEDRVNDHILTKAQRIVAELAKANTLVPKHAPVDISLYRAYKLYRAYENCRVIAEEGVKDGK